MKRTQRLRYRRGIPKFRAGIKTASVAVVAVFGLLTGCADRGGDSLAARQNVDPPLASRPTLSQELGAIVDNKVVVTFPEGGAAIAPGEGRALDLASRLFRDANPTLMFVTGHSDGVGEEYTNLLLSARRAQTVKRALVARGIPPNRLLLQALGTSDPASTSLAANAGNRRVVITWRLL